jgi:SAM-dependent methyltransferase
MSPTRAYDRFQVWLLSRVTAIHGKRVESHKRRLLPQLRGRVVEIGPGTGPNLEYYDRSIEWIGIEPNTIAHPLLLEAAARLGIDATVREATADAIPYPGGTVDAVVSTLVLCTADPEPTLREIRRVLKPGGSFVFIEHVAASRGSWLRRVQRLVKPLWKIAGGGCHPDRETWRAIEQAGFASVELERFSTGLPVVSPHVAGRAVK